TPAITKINNLNQTILKHLIVMNSDRNFLNDELLPSTRHLLKLSMNLWLNKAFPENPNCSIIDTISISILWLIQIITSVFIYDGMFIFQHLVSMSSYPSTHQALTSSKCSSTIPSNCFRISSNSRFKSRVLTDIRFPLIIYF